MTTSAVVRNDEGVSLLAATVLGPVLLPGDNGFAEEHAGFNTRVIRSPAVVVGATDAFDVQAAVRFAVDNGLPVAVQCTGHQGYDGVDRCVLITTGRMDAVHIDPVQRMARVGAGARWRSVVLAAAEFGLAPLNGSSPLVGVVGYTLGGGHSPVLGRTFGWAADHVRAVELVTADGRLHRVTESTDPDLFWAVRGGKSNFGVVTAIEFDLFPVTSVYGGGIYYDGSHTADVLHAYREWIQQVPDELNSSVGLLRLPPLPSVPEPLRGRLVVHLRVSYVGGSVDGERLVAPMRAVAPSIIDSVTELPYTEVDSIHQDPVDPMPFGERTAMLGDFTAAGVQAFVAALGPESGSTMTIAEIRHLGGALGRPSAVPNAVGNRDARFVVWGGAVGDADGIRAGLGSMDELLDRLRPWSTGGRYINFMSDHDPVELAYSEETLRRMRAVKALHDPGNLFRVNNHNIVPLAQ